jgi:hypothetical protein
MSFISYSVGTISRLVFPDWFSCRLIGESDRAIRIFRFEVYVVLLSCSAGETTRAATAVAVRELDHG